MFTHFLGQSRNSTGNVQLLDVQNTNLYTNEWHQIIIPLSSFSSDFTFESNTTISTQNILSSLQIFNLIKFGLADNFDENDEDLQLSNFEKVEVNINDIQLLFSENDLSITFPHEYKPTKIFQTIGLAWYD